MKAGSASERGSALVAAMMTSMLMLTLGSALVLLTATEARIGGRHARDAEVLAAAETALDRTLLELAAMPAWDLALGGFVRSTLTDGSPAGTRRVGDVTVDLDALTSALRCGRASCSDGDRTAYAAVRPWGSNNPHWELFAWGPLDSAVPSAGGERGIYLTVWVADDPGEDDGDPLRDGVGDRNPGRDTLLVLAQAHGAGGVRRALQATVRRVIAADAAEAALLELLAWREVR